MVYLERQKKYFSEKKMMKVAITHSPWLTNWE